MRSNLTQRSGTEDPKLGLASEAASALERQGRGASLLKPFEIQRTNEDRNFKGNLKEVTLVFCLVPDFKV